jgi:hypothetical protein
MDDRRFDSLIRQFGSGGSRRQLLKGFFGLGGVLVAGSLRPSELRAARRTTPAPAPTTPACPGNQVWNGSACVCTSGTACGPSCCPDGAQCCDNACCHGTCYGEELCCPTGSVVVSGGCFAACSGQSQACPSACQACVIIEESNPIEICANVTAQSCSSNSDCAHLGSGWVCSPFEDQCLQPC